MRFAYEIEPDDNGTWLITCPDLPEVTTFSAPDEGEARQRALEAIETAIQGRMTDRQPIPEPGRFIGAVRDRFVVLPTSTVLKVRLHRAMLDNGVRKAELARRLGWHPPQVHRLFNVNHETRLDQFDSAFRALGREIEVADREVA